MFADAEVVWMPGFRVDSCRPATPMSHLTPAEQEGREAFLHLRSHFNLQTTHGVQRESLQNVKLAQRHIR